LIQVKGTRNVARNISWYIG